MIKGIYTAASGMMTQYKKMDVVSNNLANADTAGFKKDGVVTASFGEVMMMKINDPSSPMPTEIGKMSMGVTVNQLYTDNTQGSLVQTNSPFDVAIDGEGYVTVGVIDEQGNVTEQFTRDGSFTVTNEGFLMTSEGHLVMGTEGSITIPAGEIVIDEDGTILVDGQFVDKIKLTNFEDRSTLRKIGDSLYATTDDSVVKAFDGRLQQGFIEGSNVDVVKEMAEMISMSRAYEASQKVLQANDESLGKAVNEVGSL
ncbi:flagellar basal-body rod protein FlgF [Vallitalea okinawensis]|uniref:flagellar basal-body rod protein FlgF n=1 Tax=Vallitalea okinawensis TaxID=2078660 RepID=UPI000CFC53A8|nr:flagellar basal-body rod protein FlgF [Vallitalea okinawensis]